ncbi:hypothetical protein K8R47_02855 [archaeon]|nr:hypothetical protein [archaeon]
MNSLESGVKSIIFKGTVTDCSLLSGYIHEGRKYYPSYIEPMENGNRLNIENISFIGYYQITLQNENEETLIYEHYGIPIKLGSLQEIIKPM